MKDKNGVGGASSSIMMAGNQSTSHTKNNDLNSGMSSPTSEMKATLANPASENVVQYTDVRTKAMGVKAELELLRSKQLAKNIRSEIVDDGGSVPLSSSEITDFFLRKNQSDKAWRQQQRDSMEYLHTYKHNMMEPTRTCSNKREFVAPGVYSHLDPFFQQQRAVNDEWRRQQRDSMEYLHNYRDYDLVSVKKNAEGNEKPTIVTPNSGDERATTMEEYDVKAAIAFHERQMLLDERLKQAVNCPLPPDSPVTSSVDQSAVPVDHITAMSLSGPLESSLKPNSNSPDDITNGHCAFSEKECHEERPTQQAEGDVGTEHVKSYEDCITLAKDVPSDVNPSERQESVEMNNVEDADDCGEISRAEGVSDENGIMGTGTSQDTVTIDTLTTVHGATRDEKDLTVTGNDIFPLDETEVCDADTAASSELERFDKLVSYMSLEISDENAPTILEELLGTENDDEGLTFPTKGSIEATGEEADTFTATLELHEKQSIKESQMAPATPPRRIAKIVRPQKRVTKARSFEMTDDGLSRYMKPTMSTPEKRNKFVPSTLSPTINQSAMKHTSPLYSRRETAESFKLKSTKCNNKWIPNIHDSRGGCERCLNFISEEERVKFQRDGHHYGVSLVRGGCCRSCPCFPRKASPVRLCRKCFYDTHRLGKM